LFIHNPILFVGYGINDDNIKGLLKTIFAYIEPNSPEADKIKKQFLLLEHDRGSKSVEVVDHDIELDDSTIIRINKIKTDNFKAVYDAVAEINLPVSVMDVKRVQRVYKNIVAGGEIAVKVSTDIDELNNNELVLAINPISENIVYKAGKPSQLMQDYFSIIENGDESIVKLVDKITISKNQYFPMFAFGSICPYLETADKLKSQQVVKISGEIKKHGLWVDDYHSLEDLKNAKLPGYRENILVLKGFWYDVFTEDELKKYLLDFENKDTTEYRKLLCVYDFKVYSDGVVDM
jgi:hypothetical protein